MDSQDIGVEPANDEKLFDYADDLMFTLIHGTCAMSTKQTLNRCDPIHHVICTFKI